MAAKKSGTVETVKVGSSWKITSPVELQKYVIKRGRDGYQLRRMGDLRTTLLGAPTLAELKSKIEAQMESEGMGGFGTEQPAPAKPTSRISKLVNQAKSERKAAKATNAQKGREKRTKETDAETHHRIQKEAAADKPSTPTPPPAPLNTREQAVADQLSKWGESWTVTVSTAGRTEGKTVLVGISTKVPTRVLAMLAIHNYKIGSKPDGYSRNNPKKAMRTLWLLKATDSK